MPRASSDRLFMWAGGKTKLLSHYRPLLPDDVHSRRLYEPFAGGAALFNALSENKIIDAHLSDVNGEIIRLFKMVRDNPEYLITLMRDQEEKWLPLDKEGRKKLYYELRKEYWGLDEGEEATAALYFLMKTGFNGIWQTCKASKGRYGTPVGLANQKTAVFDADTVRNWSAKLSNTDLACCGYEQVDVTPEAFVFCDPPYRDSFTSYGTDFGDDQQVKLIEWCRTAHKTAGATVWLSNRDAGDGFFEDHAPEATIHRFPVTYTAGRRKKTEDGFEAKPATEVLLVWS